MPSFLSRSACLPLLALLALMLSACGSWALAPAQAEPPSPTPTLYPIIMLATPAPSVTPVPPTATAAPPTTTASPVPTLTPTASPTAVQGVYQVRSGDTLLSIAIRHDMGLEQLLDLNDMTGNETLRVGNPLVVPNNITVNLPPADLIYDSEVVYSPSYLTFSTRDWVAARGGYLASYQEGGRSGAEIIEQVAAKYHVGPRALLASMEMLSGWVSGEPSSLYPFGIADGGPPNLAWQAAFAAKKMMEGYYGQLEGRRDWVILNNGVAARLYPGTTPGSAAIANLLAAVTPAATFPDLLQTGQFQATYHRLFGDVEGGAVRPPHNEQPYFAMPFPEQELWYFSGGPHGGYGDTYSGWAAIDFAPPVASGCWTSSYAVHAIARGLVIGSAEGETWIDMDEDGDMRTGWVLLYMHLASARRVELGDQVRAGDVLGYPSCEGGMATGAHVHIARMYNGQWMPANGPVPFQLGDWVAKAVVGSSYDGQLINTSNGDVLDACDCRSARRNRFPERARYGGP